MSTEGKPITWYRITGTGTTSVEVGYAWEDQPCAIDWMIDRESAVYQAIREALILYRCPDVMVFVCEVKEEYYYRTEEQAERWKQIALDAGTIR
jgi:hypothetical protein